MIGPHAASPLSVTRSGNVVKTFNINSTLKSNKVTNDLRQINADDAKLYTRIRSADFQIKEAVSL